MVKLRLEKIKVWNAVRTGTAEEFAGRLAKEGARYQVWLQGDCGGSRGGKYVGVMHQLGKTNSLNETLLGFAATDRA